ncbi:MAG: tRNA (adenosine(37)-N6)-threonylcarbamoyltransferase complex transferase subunit TsaD [Holosporales bacterium]|nr:tRNA (adenosine(37)-N6)-threonylcarbamoyltransferase complex transferase subunit TsaD [Holosporales bacterium]
MKVLAIESSCDETAAAVVCDAENPEHRILSNVVKSQIEIHAKYGGVVPEIAARNHVEVIDIVIQEALDQAGETLKSVDVVAATAGPGLIGGLLVGTITAKMVAMLNKKPFMAINHLEGHLLTPRLCYDVDFPHLLLLASGGHCFFAEIFGVGKYEILGQTLDDAAGEAFDKVAKMLGLEYPGGPAIEKVALKGDESRFRYTIPMQRRAGCDVSFSGIKTASRSHISKIEILSDQDKADLAASFQRTVIEHLTNKLWRAYQMSKSKPRNFILAGGVAANQALRSAIMKICDREGINFFAPPLGLCSDNAAMIGWVAIERLKAGFPPSPLTAKTRPRWPITEITI